MIRKYAACALIVASALVAVCSAAAQAQDAGPLDLRRQGVAHLPHALIWPFSGMIPAADSLGMTLTRANHWSNSDDDRAQYLIDTETTTLDLRAALLLTERVELNAELPLLWHNGGCMDSSIETFHRAFGIDQEERELNARNREQAWFDTKRGEVTLIDGSSPALIPLNPVVGLTAGLLELGLKLPAAALRVGAGLPLYAGSRSYFRPNWIEPQIGLALSWVPGPAAVHLGAGYTYIGAGRYWAGVQLHEAIFSASFTAELALGGRVRFVVQGMYDTPAYLGFGDMGNPALLLAGGLRLWLSERATLELGANENLVWFEATPDFSLVCGLRVWAAR